MGREEKLVNQGEERDWEDRKVKEEICKFRNMEREREREREREKEKLGSK